MRAYNFQGTLGLLILMASATILVTACTASSISQNGNLPPLEAGQVVPPAGIPRKYVAPTGLNGDQFGETLAQLRDHHPTLKEYGEPIAAEWRGATRNADFSGCLQFDTKGGGCRNPTMTADFDGDGTALYAEYYVAAPDEGYDIAYHFDTGGILAPIHIGVCVRYPGHGDRSIPNTVPQDARVCAFRAFHYTHLDEYRTGPHLEKVAYTPMFRQVFFSLVDTYGYPPHYRPMGRVVIELSDGTQFTSGHRPRYIDYHWGQNSAVTVDYAFNPADGAGTVYIADKWARLYAQQRHDMGDVNNLLWRLSQPGGLDHRQLEPHYEHGSLAIIKLDARVESGRVSERVRALFATGAR